MTISKDAFLDHAEAIGLSANADRRLQGQAYIYYATDPNKFFVRFSHQVFDGRVFIEWFLCGHAPTLMITGEEFLALTEREISLLTDQMINVHATSSVLRRQLSVLRRQLETIKENSKQYFRNVVDSANK